MFKTEQGESYRIADAHTHIYKQKIADKASHTIGEFYEVTMSSDMPVSETLLQVGSTVGTERYLVCSVATTLAQVSTINHFIAGEVAEHPEFIGMGAAHQDVQDFDALLDEICGLGLVGIKLHPDFQKFNIDDPHMVDLYRAATERGLKMMFHVGDERYDFSSPVRLARAIDQVPDMICHAAHFGCCRTWKRRPLPLADYPVYYDTSSMLAWAPIDEIREVIDILGTERLMWGTDFPMWDHRKELDRFFALGLSPEENRAILYDNFAKFYL